MITTNKKCHYAHHVYTISYLPYNYKFFSTFSDKMITFGVDLFLFSHCSLKNNEQIVIWYVPYLSYSLDRGQSLQLLVQELRNVWFDK